MLVRSLAWLIATAVFTSAEVAFAADEEQFSNNSDMIINGTPADEGEWPWQVRLFANDGDRIGRCGGSLIGKRWVLTAAHCVSGFVEISVGMGSTKLAEMGPDDKKGRRIRGKVIVHEKHDWGTNAHDIALIKLQEEIPSSSSLIEPVGIYLNSSELPARTKAWVTGWGATLNAEQYKEHNPDASPTDWKTAEAQSVVMMEVDVEIQDLNVCKSSYRKIGKEIPAGQLCAGYPEGGKDSCVGDSGGPLVVSVDGRFQQAGIVSWGESCAKKGFFGVYVRPDAYINWISDQIAANP